MYGFINKPLAVNMSIYILISATLLLNCTPKQSSSNKGNKEASIKVFGEDDDAKFEGVPDKVITVAKANVRAQLAGGNSFHEEFNNVKHDQIKIGRPYEVYLISAEALEMDDACGFEGLASSGYEMGIIGANHEECATIRAYFVNDGEVYSSGYRLGHVGYSEFLDSKGCDKNSRKIIIRRVPLSGYPFAYKFVGCLKSDGLLENGNFWPLEEIGNTTDRLDDKTYTWQQVFRKIKNVYYHEVKTRKGAKAWH